MASPQELKAIAVQSIDKEESNLLMINREILNNPELKYEEFKAHQLLTDFFEKAGFHVDRSYTLPTAFRAVYSPNDQGPKACVICEYDALPGIGHACGHNLIAEAGVAAALGIKAAMEASDINLGQLIVYGTPAEEGGGGKIKMIHSGCFKDIDFAMMVHPFPFDATYGNLICLQRVTATYHGKSSHAAAFPWEGVNALDAAVHAYTALSLMRQQMKSGWKIHGIIAEGGTMPNIIPATSKLDYFIRAPLMRDMQELQDKCEACFRGAAEATGCTVDIAFERIEGDYFQDVITNPIMADLYEKNVATLGLVMPSRAEQLTFPSGSTDMGNVSHILPTIHPFYAIDTEAANHTPEFTKASSTMQAHQQTIIAAKTMAMTTIDILTDYNLLESIKLQFNAQKSL
ncbi:Peptidase M20 domain-containing protein 2 [Trichoplax sp. H2]|nr:Peptidase M20 domain-containing protein 2 [Trichoplax sp. H2]|eukprot:RDD44133.1 Peptidase M20 domain-containing protein 2 [Trichoplax sp. H2]